MKSSAEKLVQEFGITLLRAYLDDRAVRDERGCLVWAGSRDSHGYGMVRLRRRGRSFQVGAHRVAFLLHHGEISADLTIDHLCRNRACIEPSHLDECTRGENVLRSPDTFSGKNIRKTHCPKGHPLCGDNLVPAQLARGRRDCWTCYRKQNAEAQARRKQRLRQ